MDDEGRKKFRVAFCFVEAGMGHIMPLRAVCDAFEKKYGGNVEVVRTNFFGDNPELKFIEDDFIDEVKRQNKHKGRGALQFLLLRLFGYGPTMAYIYKARYRRGFAPALGALKKLDADMIFSTHFSTLYYACEAKKAGLIGSAAAAYIPDPVIGGQWDARADFLSLSSRAGKAKAEKSLRLRKTPIIDIPFLIRGEIGSYDKDKYFYRDALGLPRDNFTVLCADGAYGAGRLRDTVYGLFGSRQRMTVVAVCGKNEPLFREFCALVPPPNITFAPYGFTDKTLMLAAAADLFMGKAGASNLAEPSYFGVPSIVTFLATPIEKWICRHYTDYIGCAVKETNIKKACKTAEEFCKNPESLAPYVRACAPCRRRDGAELLADAIFARLKKRTEPGTERRRTAFGGAAKSGVRAGDGR